MNIRTLSLLAIAGTFSFGHAQTVNFYETASLNLNSYFGLTSPYGTNLSAIAYDGSNLYVGGYNDTAGSSSTSIMKVTNPWASASASVFGNSTNNATAFRGYTGLATDSSGNLYASFDNGGGTSMDGLFAYSSTGTSLWSNTAPPSGTNGRAQGVAIDPGYNGSGGGVSSTYFSSGREWKFNPSTGAYENNGFIFYPGSGGTYMRSLTFDPNGNVYVRGSGNVYAGTRNGANSGTSPKELYSAGNSGITQQVQNIAWTSLDGGSLIYNLVPDNHTASFASDVVMINASSGASIGVNFLNASGSGMANILNGSKAYDFKWDAATNQLVVGDYANNAVYLFSTQAAPEPTSILALSAGALALLARKRKH